MSTTINISSSDSASRSTSSVEKSKIIDSETVHDERNPALMLSESEEAKPELVWTKTRSIFADAFGEFVGVCIIILFGDGVVAQVVLSGGEKGSYQSISWGWGLGVMFGVLASGRSGGHLNPAVTLANCIFRKFPWRKFPIYFISQLLGAMVGAAIVYGNYRNAFDAFEGGPGIRTVGLATSSAGVFCTYPAAFMTRTGMFFSEFVASSILMFLLYAMADSMAPQLIPLGLFMLIFAIGACFGWETGYAINLARDFGPRLVSYGLGYGHEVWSYGGYYFWIPMVAPFFGCLFGAFLYDLLIFTGDSPVNTPWFGFKRLFQWRRDVWSNTYVKEETSKV